MTRDAKPTNFMVSVLVSDPDAHVLDMLERAGLTVDHEYGLVKVDQHGRQRIARVRATEGQVEQAELELPFTFFPDIGVEDS
jgi:hypothetical protein